jgi:anaerobic ribonucleoside-triphosphate reductase
MPDGADRQAPRRERREPEAGAGDHRPYAPAHGRESQKTGLNFTLLATPAEGFPAVSSGSTKRKYGKIEGVTDREYYTNSFHMPVYCPIKRTGRSSWKRRIHALCNAGTSAMWSWTATPRKNLDAFESVIRCMKEAASATAR